MYYNVFQILEGSNQECDHLKTDLFKAQEEIKRLTKENDAFVAAERTKEDEKVSFDYLLNSGKLSYVVFLLCYRITLWP